MVISVLFRSITCVANVIRMRCCFEEDPEADITQIALWQAYQARFNEYTARGFPLLPAAEFIKNVSVAFQNASAMVLPTPQGQKFIIKGIRARETPMSVNGRVHLACKWFNTPGNAVSRCTAQLPSPQDLWAHVLNVHLTPPPPDASGTSRPLWCNWAGCPRFGSEGERERLKVVAHVRTHMPDARKRPMLSKEEQEMMEDPDARVIIKRCQTAIEHETGHACGIPMTSVLVLRNIRKRGGHKAKVLIDSWKDELADVMSLNKPLAELVGDLVVGGLGGPE
jgi:chromatin structure-remodeling complex subunit RSC9